MARRRGVRSRYEGGRVHRRDGTVSALIPDLAERQEARSQRLTRVLRRREELMKAAHGQSRELQVLRVRIMLESHQLMFGIA